MLKRLVLPAVTAIIYAAVASDTSAAEVGSLPADSIEIIAAVKDCNNAIGPASFNGEVLKTNGWLLAKKQDGEITAGIKSETAFFAKTGGQVINIVQILGGLSVHCRTTAKLQNEEQFSEIRAALISAYSAQPATEFSDGNATDAEMVKRTPKKDRGNILLNNNRRFILSNRQPLQITIGSFPKRTKK